MENKCSEVLKTFYLGCFGIILVVLLSGWLVMLLWNWIMPNIVPGIYEIDILEAYGLTLLSRLLFGTRININK